MSELYWESKISALLSASIFGSLNNNTTSDAIARSPSTPPNWLDRVQNKRRFDSRVATYLDLAANLGDRIATASDRASLSNYHYTSRSDRQNIQISHLLSGASQTLPLDSNLQLGSNGLTLQPEAIEEILKEIPPDIKADKRLLFWYLWRCLPVKISQTLNSESSSIFPANTVIPDTSIWSYTSIKSTLTGALTGYDTTPESILEQDPSNLELCHPHIAAFTFSPIQELVKASRKMRDFWAGSWVLHYLSAKVAWGLANKYGPDCLLYPSLYQQPLIDLWLHQEYKPLREYIHLPTDRQLLTAGFPNVLIVILPKNKVAAAMQMAKSILLDSWAEVSQLVLEELQQRNWMEDLKADNKRWSGWLKHQWQTYWVGVPIGREWQQDNEDKVREKLSCDRQQRDKLSDWCESQNKAFNIHENRELFQPGELNFLNYIHQQSSPSEADFNVNVGSWWGYIFDQTRLSLAAVKNARDWQLPTAFDTRSTISGIGSVVHPKEDGISESDSKQIWKHRAGLFDGKEQLNATEVVKRGLHRVLHRLLKISDSHIDNLYPDLTAGVAGYLKTAEPQQVEHFIQACEAVQCKLNCDGYTIGNLTTKKWGIPWIDEDSLSQIQSEIHHSRLLNAGWLIDELNIEDEQIPSFRPELQELINTYYPNHNPADWYVIAAGDGDSMSEWLKGSKLGNYRDYVDVNLAEDKTSDELQKFLDVPKRMGPSTHSALSRSLLDFSNQLVPYLTETRYAGRLIYSGGDDVLAYTNLWEWDKWLWDIRECFRGQPDPQQEFSNDGDYWLWNGKNKSPVAPRPLFTLGKKATISFGIVIAHHSVPLAIALSNLWEAEEAAKEHIYELDKEKKAKDALQVRVMYGNGNSLVATAKFQVLQAWKQVLQVPDLDSSIFEQIANIYQQHPIPEVAAIGNWTQAVVSRRENLNSENRQLFQDSTAKFMQILWETTPHEDRDREIVRWFKLAAFTLRETKFTVNTSINSSKP